MSENNIYVKVVADQFLTVADLVHQITDATGLQTDRIKPDRGQYVAFLSSGDSVGVANNKLR